MMEDNKISKDMEKIVKEHALSVFFVALLVMAMLVTISSNRFAQQSEYERGYFDGQKDAMQGKIKLINVRESIWTWRESPWPDGKKVIYKP